MSKKNSSTTAASDRLAVPPLLVSEEDPSCLAAVANAFVTFSPSIVVQQRPFHVVMGMMAIMVIPFLCKMMNSRKQHQQQRMQVSQTSNKSSFTSHSVAVAAATTTTATTATATATATAALERKHDFLSRHPNEYGYRNSVMGYIDDWRPKEFPTLQPPLEYCYNPTTTIHDNDKRNHHDDLCHVNIVKIVKDDTFITSTKADNEKEVYLDYAGSALPMKSQLQQIFHDHTTQMLANPHSMTGPSAARTSQYIQTVKTRILQHFAALPGRFASLSLPESFFSTKSSNSNPKIEMETSDWSCHAGYDLVFTSGATEGCKILAERFPWQRLRHREGRCGQQCQNTSGSSSSNSIFLYVTNSHNSVVGRRQLALAQGAIFHCIDMSQLQAMTVQDFERLERQLLVSQNSPKHQKGKQMINPTTASSLCLEYQTNSQNRRHLLVFPLECNFGGDVPTNAASIIATAKQCGWYTLLDIAKAASTGPVLLRELDPDFAVLSFYKLFGEPTGVGALLVKRSSIPILFEINGGDDIDDDDDDDHDDTNNFRQSQVRHYQGGGSVDIMMPKVDYVIPKQSPKDCLDSLVHGTVHFRGIVSLLRGFETLDRLGGMTKIHQHSSCLARE